MFKRRYNISQFKMRLKMFRSKKTRLVLFVFLLLPILIIVNEVLKSMYNDFRSMALAMSSDNTLRQTKYSAAVANLTDFKKILFFNDYFGYPEHVFTTGQKPFLDNNCEYNKCYTTGDRKMFSAEELDALIWHGRSFDRSFPDERFPHTRYIFYLLEAPVYSVFDFSKLNGVFNYTMTYRREADIKVPYGSFVKKITPSKSTEVKNYAEGKTKMAAWFVSHCFSSSSRESLADDLQKYLPVDIFGVCGPHECSTRERDKCYRQMEENYKFYLAFENSLCEDYVTEKFFSVSRFNVIPVVYGLADYKKIAPPKSYINVMDFKNVKELAEYLIYLDKNDTAYNEYFEWKNDFDVKQTGYGRFCELCEKLHTEKEPKVYEDMYAWYEKDRCIPPIKSVTTDGTLGVSKRFFDITYYNLYKTIFR